MTGECAFVFLETHPYNEPFRSQKGNGDSEIALVVEDTDMVDSRMDGEPVCLLSTNRGRNIHSD